MRAYELHGVNDLRREDIEKPEIPSGWVLVQVKASGICSSDIPRIFTNGTYHFPTIPGHEFSGVVAAYGEGVPEERVGKRVGIFPLIPCRTCPQCRQKKYEMCEHYDYLGSRRDGGFAEYVAVPDWNLMELPENVSMRQAILGFDHETPVKGVLSSNFGYRDHPLEGTERFHYGVDLAADTGTAIACFADGTVTAVGESSSYGKYCTVTHANGCTTLYAHCGRISVSSGAAVKKGEKLGEVGETGMATGPHLHFELQKDGVYLNPIYYVETA